MAIVGNSVAWFLVWLFSRAVFYKLAAPGYYRRLIEGHLGGTGGAIALWLIGLVEAAIALSLLFAHWRPAGLASAAALLLLYAGLMARQILSGNAGMDCGCAGADSHLGISWALVLRNGICAALALLTLCAAGSGAVGWVASAVTGVLALFFIVTYLASDAIISNAQWMEGDG